ncbi:3-keto-5-aminohexanoate cleavage protein [Clostridium sp. WLY-B-L2]|uniref:3-keto-5-aminohexanoate cleavage protein n=1 Tax=Clostridium aromativorans TaxID=2836848 RepID=A0ABS8N8Y1_9CLOT|nr:3-keto-5-aminohexanoate cleavage protein [Clostridium aromativorans]MCC9295619.1 3-keto-5-aminohexanoate cleavage protein [Clostridium aromativorans]
MEKIIVTAALTGAFPRKDKNPNIPTTPQEIANEAYECWKAGAAIVHLHMIDEEGRGTMNKDKFAETVELIKSKCDVVINLTTSGDLNATDETRMAHLVELKPEMASYDAGTMNWMNNSVFYNTPAFLEKLGNCMKTNNVKPEVEIFDAGMIYNTLYYVKKGVLDVPTHYQLVLGAVGGTAATVENLVYLKNLLPKGSTWSAFGIGKQHLPILYATIALGGHVRVGLEDNIYYSYGKIAKSNVEFVERAVRVIKEANKEEATPAEAREILGIK